LQDREYIETFAEQLVQPCAGAQRFAAKHQRIAESAIMKLIEHRLWCIFPRHAQVAELVDALASGASGRKLMGMFYCRWIKQL